MLNAVATFFVTGFLAAFLNKTPSAGLLFYVFILSGAVVTVIRMLIPFGINLLYPLLFMLKSQFELFSAIYARMSTTIIRTTINQPANSILIGFFPESYRDMIRPFLRGTVVRLDQLILRNLKHQDEDTQVALIKMISPDYGPRAAKELVRHLSPHRHETTIAILKFVIQHGIQAVKPSEFSCYMNSSQKNFSRAYQYLAMAQSLENLTQGGLRDLAMEHLKEKKKRYWKTSSGFWPSMTSPNG